MSEGYTSERYFQPTPPIGEPAHDSGKPEVSTPVATAGAGFINSFDALFDAFLKSLSSLHPKFGLPETTMFTNSDYHILIVRKR